MAIAIENARLYDEINQRLKELQSLNDIGQAITNEVTVYVEPNDDDACSQSEGKNNGNKVRIAPVQFVYNR